ncbi:HlyC/CorC family transporter [Hoyosella rhizosphaerae]|uniref:Membrane protein n=1 Tax=Hoyosella rhizosphaerae TaxID=1755582 RepID=A0A916U4K8_9ACTN|nr:hemolysin family protein [Hoyosella rhizosphaerae]MBN4926679.1 HlyC/CorC family transporter [Hoyosella rhizosphaerae]GGC57317.1 membrane protein [Hoyosella rhizosphaerae]
MINITGMLIGIALLFGNAFFVGAEFALVSTRRTQIEPRAEAGSRVARITLRALDNVSLMMAGAQLGITMCSLGLGAVAEPAVAYALEIPLEAIGVPSAFLHPIAVVIALTIVLSLHMTIGEMVPKNLAIAGPERTAMILGPILYVLVQIMKPLLLLINFLANTVLRILRVTPREKVATAFTADEVAGFVSESMAEGLIDHEEHQLLTGALTMSRETIETITVPRSELAVLSMNATISQAQQECVRTGYSRFPLADAHGDLAGYVHVKDLLSSELNADDPLPARVMRPLPRFTANTLLDDALEGMQAGGVHVALVSGTSGDIIGVAMLEDVVERLIGEIGEIGEVTDRPTSSS